MRSLGGGVAGRRTARTTQYGVNWASSCRGLRRRAVLTRSARAGRGAARGATGALAWRRALWLAGDALGDDGAAPIWPSRRCLATLRRPVEQRFIDSPTFCHGVAGLLQIVLRFAHATGAATGLRRGSRPRSPTSCWPPTSRTGRSATPPWSRARTRSIAAGLLDGAPGVALVLLAAATDVEPTWDRLFLLT